MRYVNIEALVPFADPDQVFARISDFPRYKDYTEAVREIKVTAELDRATLSEWSVYFRNGILCWTERDEIDSEQRTIDFEQLDGDFDKFSGTWTVTPVGHDVRAVFTASFDLGMPSLAGIIDPIAEHTLRENMCSILRGLLGPGVKFLDGNAQIPVTESVER